MSAKRAFDIDAIMRDVRTAAKRHAPCYICYFATKQPRP